MKNIILLILLFITNIEINSQTSFIKFSGPPSGCTAVAVHPWNSQLIFAGTQNSGIFRSTDGGLTWGPYGKGYPILPSLATASTGVGKIIFDLDYPDIIYICSGYDETGQGAGILRSTDCGANWAIWGTGLPQASWISELSINPYNHNEFYAVAPFGLFKSTNRGADWSRMTVNNPSGPVVFPERESLRFCLFTSNGNIIETADGGGLYKVFRSGLGDYMRSYSSCVDSLTGDIYFSNYSGLFKKTGRKKIASLESKFQISDPAIQVTGPISSYARIAYNPKSGTVFANTNYGLFRSSDHGNNWTFVLPDIGTKNLWAGNKTVFYANDKMIVSTRDGLMASKDDGLTWQFFSNGPTASAISDIQIFSKDPKHWLAINQNGTYSYGDTAANWSRFKNKILADALCIAYNPLDNNVIFVGANGYAENHYGLLRTKDGGKNWQDISPAENLSVTAIAVNPVDPKIVYFGAGENVWKTSDGGDTWKIINNQPGSYMVRLIKIAPSNPVVVYVSRFGSNPANTGIYLTENGGNTWYKRVKGLTYTDMTAMAVHPTNSYIVFAGNASDGMFKTTDAGQSWMPINDFKNVGANSYKISDILFKQENPNEIYTSVAGPYQGDMAGLYYSKDFGATWQKQSIAGIPNYSFSVLRRYMTGSTEHLLAGTAGGGIVEFISTNSTLKSGVKSGK